MKEANLQSSCLIILGMHRSGTSAITGVLHHLGITLGDNLIPAEQHINPKGFWEHASVSAVDESILEVLGSHWFDAMALPQQWWLKDEIQPYYENLKSLIKEQFGNEESWAIKDPRLCRLMHLWKPLLLELQIAPKVLLILRNPLEVACSLQDRDGIQLPHALLLWMRYVLDSQQGSRGLPRVIVTYDALLDCWESTIEKIQDTLVLDFEITPEARSKVNAFLERRLKHHTVSPSVNDFLSNLAMRLYEDICSGNTDKLDIYEQELEALINEVTPWLSETNYLMGERIKYKLESQRLAESNANLEREILRIKSTYSWRMTGPLRGVWNFCKGLSPRV